MTRDRKTALSGTGGPVHFMGIAGAGMRALAEALARKGVPVTGCDTAGTVPPALVGLDVPVAHGHDAAHVTGASVLVRTAAVPEDHAEVRAARAAGIPVLKRAEALGAFVAEGTVIAVAGTHGKTSTTGMLTTVLDAAGMDPTGFVGGHVHAWGGNLRSGSADWYVVEADEYDRSFLHLDPSVAVVTNVEADHLDIYGDFDGVVEAFRQFVARIRPEGALVACADDHGASRLLFDPSIDVITYGTSAGSMVRATDVERAPEGGVRFRVREEGQDRGPLRIPVPGLHNVRNALGAAAASRRLGVEWDAIVTGLAAWEGVGRRFQRLGDAAGVTVVDDYAHHPTEVAVTVSAARQAYPDRTLVVVFQPHLYTRTKAFHREFGRALAAADRVWVTDVYPAREAPLPGVTGALVADAVAAAGGKVDYHADLATLTAALAPTLSPGDVCLTMGAGSIEHLGSGLMRHLTAEETP